MRDHHCELGRLDGLRHVLLIPRSHRAFRVF
jgi:hypothetical protein